MSCTEVTAQFERRAAHVAVMGYVGLALHSVAGLSAAGARPGGVLAAPDHDACGWQELAVLAQAIGHTRPVVTGAHP